MRRRLGWREGLAAALGALAVLVGVVLALSQRSERLAYSNTRVESSETATVVEPGGEYCGNLHFPESAAIVRLYGGTRGLVGPPVEVTVSTLSRRLLTSGRRAGDYGDNRPVDIRLRTPHEGADLARICIRNLGENVVQFADAQSLSGAISVREEEAFMRMDLLLDGRPRNVDLAGKVAGRASLMKSSLIGTWTIWALVPLMLGLAAVAVLLVVREARR